MKNLKAVLFDLDGTLINTIDDLATAVNVSLTKNGFPTRTVDEVKSFVGNGIGLLVKRALPKDTSDDLCEQCLKDFYAYYLNHLTDFTRPYDGVIDLLNELKVRGYKTGVISNKEITAAREICKQFFGDLTDSVIGEGNGIHCKPSTDMPLAILSEFNLSKDDVVLLGDSDVDVKTAENAGLSFVGVTWGFRTEEQLKNAGATVIIDHPMDFLKLLE